MYETGDTNSAVSLRSQVVTEVVRAIIGLTFVLYIAVFALLLTHRVVPGELWLAAGNASGALIALLVNSKNDAPVPDVGSPDSPSVGSVTLANSQPDAPAFDPSQPVVAAPDSGVPVDA